MIKRSTHFRTALLAVLGEACRDVGVVMLDAHDREPAFAGVGGRQVVRVQIAGDGVGPRGEQALAVGDVAPELLERGQMPQLAEVLAVDVDDLRAPR